MKYRRLGKTGLLVSEIGFGGEWMERHTPEECKAVLEEAAQSGINILDCWMSEPNVRSSLGVLVLSLFVCLLVFKFFIYFHTASWKLN